MCVLTRVCATAAVTCAYLCLHTPVHTCCRAICTCAHVRVQQQSSTTSTHRAPVSQLLPAGTTQLHRCTRVCPHYSLSHTRVHARTCVCSHMRVQQPRSTHRALESLLLPAGTTWLHRHLHTMAYHTRVHTCSVYVSVQQPCSTRSTHRAPESLLLPAGTTLLHIHLHTRVHTLQPVTHVCMHICVCAHTCVCNSHAALTEPL